MRRRRYCSESDATKTTKPETSKVTRLLYYQTATACPTTRLLSYKTALLRDCPTTRLLYYTTALLQNYMRKENTALLQNCNSLPYYKAEALCSTYTSHWWGLVCSGGVLVGSGVCVLVGSGGICFVLVGFWWALVCSGGFWWLLVGFGVCW